MPAGPVATFNILGEQAIALTPDPRRRRASLSWRERRYEEAGKKSLSQNFFAFGVDVEIL
jgi:hypothetical protein